MELADFTGEGQAKGRQVTINKGAYKNYKLRGVIEKPEIVGL